MSGPGVISNATRDDLKQLGEGHERTFVIEAIADAHAFILPDVIKGAVQFACDVNISRHLCQSLEAGRVVFKNDLRVDSHAGLGDLMTGGEIVVEGSFEGCSIGSHMKGGYIWLKGECAANEIGEQMSGGQIHIEGDCRCDGDYGRIGSDLEQGMIHIRGNVTCRRGIRGNPTNPSSLHIGYDMRSGEIRVDGDVESDDGLDVGCHMKQGKIRVQGSVLASRLAVGTDNGHFSVVDIDGHCMTGDIGLGLTGGEVKVGGSTRGSIGHGMEQGSIVVNGDVDHRDVQGQICPIGSGMTGGRIEIWGNAREFNLVLSCVS